MEDISFLWNLIEKGKNGENIGASTGLPKLDKIIGGIQPARYYLLGAASSAGKTSFVLYMMYYMLKNATKDAPVYFQYYSLEIGSEVLLAKLLALYCAEEYGIYLTINDIFSFESKLSDYHYQCLNDAKSWLQEIRNSINIIDTTVNAKNLYATISTFAERYGKYVEENGKKRFVPNNPRQKVIGIIDHLNLVQPSEGRKLKEEIDLMSSYMVTIKRKLQVSWFALMQQNRESSSMDRRKADLSEPGLNDLKDSSTPAQDADVVLQLFYPFREKLTSYRGYPILGDNGFKNTFRSIITSKNRYGVANQVIGCAFYGSVGWFKELKKIYDKIWLLENNFLFLHKKWENLIRKIYILYNNIQKMV